MIYLNETTCWIYMSLILAVLLVVLWNIFKQFANYSVISRLLITLTLAMLGLLLIGEIIIQVPNGTLLSDSVNLKQPAEMDNLQSTDNPCVSLVMVFTAVFMIIGSVAFIIWGTDYLDIRVQQFLKNKHY